MDMLVLMTLQKSVTYLRESKQQVMASLSLRNNFAATIDLYSTFIKQMKAENPQLNVSEVSFARGKAGKNSYGKHHSTGISNVSNAAVDERFFEKHEYNALTVNTSGKAGVQIPQLPLGDNSSPWGDNAVCM
jgi:hypothetical protein